MIDSIKFRYILVQNFSSRILCTWNVSNMTNARSTWLGLWVKLLVMHAFICLLRVLLFVFCVLHTLQKYLSCSYWSFITHIMRTTKHSFVFIFFYMFCQEEDTSPWIKTHTNLGILTLPVFYLLSPSPLPFWQCNFICHWQSHQHQSLITWANNQAVGTDHSQSV